ncbi:MAG: hypothetical protein CG437_1235 [Methanosaeta sp. NSP1]|nr:MAG: hypothetical protein CG437_1235 [Methanosaeta sp. NSP1]
MPWRGAYAGVAPAHIFHYSGTDSLRVGDQSARTAFIPGDADLAFFPITAACEPTELSKAPPGRGRAGERGPQEELSHLRCLLVHSLCGPSARGPSWPGRQRNASDPEWQGGWNAAILQYAHLQRDRHIRRDDKGGGAEKELNLDRLRMWREMEVNSRYRRIGQS